MKGAWEELGRRGLVSIKRHKVVLSSLDHFGIILVPQVQISNRLRRWEVRDRLRSFLNQRTADELKNQLFWFPKE